MIVTVAGLLRVLDGHALLDNYGLLFRKSAFRSRFPLDEYGIRRILLHFLLASLKSSPQSRRIRFLDKTERNRITAVLPFHHEFLPLHPDIFCNIALDHLISFYAFTNPLSKKPSRFSNLIEPYEQAVVCKTFVWEGLHIMISILPYPTQSRNCWSKIICTMQLWCHVNHVGLDVLQCKILSLTSLRIRHLNRHFKILEGIIYKILIKIISLIFPLMGVIKGSKWWFKVVLKSLGNIYNMF